MTTQANKALLRRYLEAWGAGDTGAMLNLLDSHTVTHNLATGKEMGVDFEIEACQIWHAGFSAVTLTIEKLVAEGDEVAAYWSLAGRHTGDFAGIPATGKDVVVPGMEINRMVNGKIVEIWRLSDTMSLMQQLGAVPAP